MNDYSMSASTCTDGVIGIIAQKNRVLHTYGWKAVLPNEGILDLTANQLEPLDRVDVIYHDGRYYTGLKVIYVLWDQVSKWRRRVDCPLNIGSSLCSAGSCTNCMDNRFTAYVEKRGPAPEGKQYVMRNGSWYVEDV